MDYSELPFSEFVPDIKVLDRHLSLAKIRTHVTDSPCPTGSSHVDCRVLSGPCPPNVQLTQCQTLRHHKPGVILDWALHSCNHLFALDHSLRLERIGMSAGARRPFSCPHFFSFLSGRVVAILDLPKTFLAEHTFLFFAVSHSIGCFSGRNYALEVKSHAHFRWLLSVFGHQGRVGNLL